MTDSEWVPHDGSPNPAPGWLVEVEFRAGSRSSKPKPSDVWVWHHKDSGADILLYRKHRPMTGWERRNGRSDPRIERAEREARKATTDGESPSVGTKPEGRSAPNQPGETRG